MNSGFSFQSSIIRGALVVAISLGLVAAQEARAFCVLFDHGGNPDAGGGSLLDSTSVKSKSIPSELKALDSFDKAYAGFRDQYEKLDQTTRVTSLEWSRLRTSAARLKAAIPAEENAVRSIIIKGKAKGKWSSESDALVVEQRKQSGLDSRAQKELIATVDKSGGARKLMEETLSSLPLLGREVDVEVNRFQRAAAESQFGTPFRRQTVSFSVMPAATVGTLFGDIWKAISAVGKIFCLFLC